MPRGLCIKYYQMTPNTSSQRIAIMTSLKLVDISVSVTDKILMMSQARWVQMKRQPEHGGARRER